MPKKNKNMTGEKKETTNEDLSKKNMTKEKQKTTYKDASKKKTEEKQIVLNPGIFSNLREEIVLEIFARIPPSYLFRNFIHLSKSWYSVISRSDFLVKNSNHSNPQLFIQNPTTRRETKYKTTILEIDDLNLDLKLHNVAAMGEIKSSYNGCRHSACGAALGYDPSTKQYKVVHIYSDNNGFEIFTLGCPDNSWRRIPGPFPDMHDRPFDVFKFSWSDPVSINGEVLHWDVDSPEYIISMDVSNERSIRTPTPDRREKSTYYLLEMGGYLALAYGILELQMDIWILKDFHAQVWVKKLSITSELTSFSLPSSSHRCNYTNALPSFKKLTPVASVRDGEVIVFCSEYGIYLYKTRVKELVKVNMKVKDEMNFVVHRSSLIWWEANNQF